MSTNEERSFIARVTCNGSPITFLQELMLPALLNTEALPKNIITAQNDYDRAPKLVRDPFTNEMVPVGYSIPTKDTVVVHFICYGDYYNMKIVGGPYDQMYISHNDKPVLAALPPAGANTTSFNLLDVAHNIITLDDLRSDRSTVYLKARNAGVIRKQITTNTDRYSVFNDRSGDIVKFELNILKRHAV
ncbi:hypothetical protein [Pseudomonas sp. NFX15]|uniref:hypothetical protein n=1 Tax=Pseudomonas sp. NFX15 TaxID=2816958 RepID=UPI003B8C0005